MDHLPESLPHTESAGVQLWALEEPMRLIALAILVSALPAAAKEREGVTSEPTIRVGGKELHLMGMGLRKKLWFKVYIASFYLENPTEDAAQAVSSDQVKRVEMRMLRDLERGKIVEAVQAGFEKNSADQMPRLQSRLETFLKAIPDLKPGEAINVMYVPGKGTIVKAGGSDEITIEGKDFADALFSVWLGPHPVDDELKNEMLKNR
jgi:Chalcone isomerase-like